MEKKKKKNRIILCICSIFILVASIFSFIPVNKQSNKVYADTVSSDYSFSGSNISSKTTFTSGNFSYNYFNIDYIGDFNSLDYVSVSPYLELQSNYINEYLNINYNNDQYDFTRGNYGDILTHFKFVNLLPNTIYTISFVPVSVSDTSARYHFASKYDIQNSLGSTLFSSFTTDSNGEWIINYGVWISARNCSFVVSNVSLVQGSSVLPYVPYQNSTQVNYEFDISSVFYQEELHSAIDITFDISNGMNFTRVSGSSSHTDQGFTYKTDSYAVNGGFVENSYPLYFASYDYVDGNKVINYDYMFKLYYSFNYIDTDGYDTNSAFTSNIVAITLGSYLDKSYFGSMDNWINREKYNFISYIDSNNNNLNFFIPLVSDVSSDYWDFRTYYTSNASTDSTGAFNNGYNSGYKAGYDTGVETGYSDGYKNGKTTGYNNGYNAGVQAGNDYTFLSLVSSVIDAPLNYFTSLFNFELLGVNLQGFLMALFTLCVVVTIVKLCLGR